MGTAALLAAWRGASPAPLRSERRWEGWAGAPGAGVALLPRVCRLGRVSWGEVPCKLRCRAHRYRRCARREAQVPFKPRLSLRCCAACMGLGSRPDPPIADRRGFGAGSWSRRVSGRPEQAHLRRSSVRREPRAAPAALTGDRSSLEACEDWATAAGALDGGGCLPSAP